MLINIITIVWLAWIIFCIYSILRYCLKLLKNINKKNLIQFFYRLNDFFIDCNSLNNYRTCRDAFQDKIAVLIGFVFYLFQKIIPRIFICISIPWILKENGLITGLDMFERGLLTNEGVIIASIFLLFFVFIKYSPRAVKLYLIQETNSTDEYRKIFKELDEHADMCKNWYLTYGVYSVENSYLVKGKCKIDVNRLYYELRRRYNFDKHEKIIYY